MGSLLVVEGSRLVVGSLLLEVVQPEVVDRSQREVVVRSQREVAARIHPEEVDRSQDRPYYLSQ